MITTLSTSLTNVVDNPGCTHQASIQNLAAFGSAKEIFFSAFAHFFPLKTASPLNHLAHFLREKLHPLMDSLYMFVICYLLYLFIGG